MPNHTQALTCPPASFVMPDPVAAQAEYDAYKLALHATLANLAEYVSDDVGPRDDIVAAALELLLAYVKEEM